MRKSIRNRRGRSKLKKGFELQLTSMMDMLIIIVVFMLKSYSASSVAFDASGKIKLPTSISEDLLTDSPGLVIEPDGIIFENERIVDFTAPESYEINPKLLADGGRRIMPLYDAFIRSKEKTEHLMAKAVWKDEKGNQIARPNFQGNLIIQADKKVRYEFLKKIMYTAGAAEFKIFKLVTLKKEI